ncbi:MAG: OmpA family protein [Lentimicrobiaceae bacterium]|nr:OmpA family protein [Lentimicrobiaceae bacterium]
MKTVSKILAISGIIMMSGMSVQAQFGDKLGKAIKKSAENAAVRKAEQKTDQAVSKSIDKATDPNSYKNDKKDDSKNSNQKGDNGNQSSNADNGAAKSQTGKNEPQDVKTAEMAYAKSDFVPGDVIFFDDNTANEKLGEFPSQWDLNTGNAEIAMINGEKCINMIGKTIIIPLMNPSDNYLPEEFTIEYDIFGDVSNGNKVICEMGLKDGSNIFIGRFYNMEERSSSAYKWVETVNVDKPRPRSDRTFVGRFIFNESNVVLSAIWFKPDGGYGEQIEKIPINPNGWQHISISFNKRALKYYVNGVRVLNIPNMIKPTSLWFWAENGNTYFKDLRIAKGAVPLYDRMVNEGKIISYGITFDVGKSTLKPESMGEINRIAALMKENPELKFSVEGHTDNTGTTTNNQTLSDARSQAVVNKLVEMGISKDRLKSAGKGQTSPIADNATDEGRAKNRRVEFVKIK